MGSACTSTTQSSTQLPEWLTGPASQTIQRAVDQTNKPYQAYGGELTAGINPTQQLGIDTLTNNNGSWTGQFGQAQNALSAFTNAPTATDAGSPYIKAGADISTVGQSLPYLLAGMDQDAGLSAAAPYLAGASQTAPSALSAYMNPYQTGVVDEIARLGSRNLTENIMPGINDTFIRSGQFGSDRNAQTIGRAIRDTQRDISGVQANALAQGYQQAGSLFTSDANRLAQLAGTTGNLGESAASRALSGGNIIGNLSAGDANRQITAGNALAGLADTDRTALLNASKQGAALAGQQQQQTIGDANALMAAGGVQQQTQQRADDAAKAQFLEGRDWNQNQLSWLNSIIRGTPTPSTTTQSATSSPLSSAAGIAALLASFGFKDGGRVPRFDTPISPLHAIAAKHFRRGGSTGDDEEDDLFPAETSPLGADFVLGDVPGQMRTSADDDGGGDDDADLSDMVLLAQAPAGPGVGTGKPAQPSALEMLRDRASKRSEDDPDLKAAMEGVQTAQTAAMERKPRDKTWFDNPLALAGLSILATPPGTSGLAAIGQGALAAVKQRQAERRLDQNEDQARRMDALKVAQQRLSNILNIRSNDRQALVGLARAEALQNRQQMPKTTAAMAEAEAMGFDLKTPQGRKSYQDWKIGQTREPQGGTYAPTDIEKWGMILKDPNADPILKDAARRALGAKGNRDLTPAQMAQLRGRAATLAQADVAGLGKDFQFKTPEDQQAFIADRTAKHLAWLQSGADPDAAPPVATAPATAPATAAPSSAVPPASGDPLAEATPEDLHRIATDPNYPADPAMREAAKARLAATGRPAAAPTQPTARGDKRRDVPANMVTAMSTNAQGIRQIDKAMAALAAYPDGVGMKAGALNLLPGPALDAADPKGTEVRALIADIGSLKLHDRSGAAITASEFPRLKPFIPNVYDSPETIKKKLANFRSVYQEILADQYGAFGPAAGYKANARMEEVLGTAKKGDDNTGTQKPPAERKAAIMATGKRPDGVGSDWDLKLHAPTGLLVWASPDGKKRIPAESE